ncbi:MAG: hypothetical protein ACI841_000724 [Planctomycetota bacterium]|jgi:hypothetical protein
MSGMDGVGPGRRPIQPNGPRRASDAKRAKKADSEFTIGETAETGEAQEAVVDASPRFDTLKKRILEGVDGEMTKEEVMRAVIGDEVRQSFAGVASKEMTDSIAQAFDNNENLKALFNRLYGQALRERKSGQ